MSFISFEFAILFVIAFVAYYGLGHTYRRGVLLLASGVFVGFYHLDFLVAALLISGFTYAMGFAVEQAKGEKRRRWTFYSAVAVIVVCWLLLRYPIGLEEAVNVVLHRVGVSGQLQPHSILFPLGISFYSFQAIAYLTEIYWEEQKAERSLTTFLVFMLFFMKFLSGPIERPDGLLRQLKEPVTFDYAVVTGGAWLIFLGLTKKLVIADSLAPYVDQVYGSLGHASGLSLLGVCLLYPVQLYTDFSGYTDIAIGGAAMFGFRLVDNFDRPFVSRTTAELWRRWHMSLSFWVRDYVYMPLSAELRGWGKRGIVVSLLTTFVVLGIWHGAGWNYVVYGALQGLIIIYEMQAAGFRSWQEKLMGERAFGQFSIVRTYLLFALTLVCFRANSLGDATYLLSHLSLTGTTDDFFLGMSTHNRIVVFLSLAALLLYEYFNAKSSVLETLRRQRTAVRWTVYFVLLALLFFWGQFNSDTFVYLQF